LDVGIVVKLFPEQVAGFTGMCIDIDYIILYKECLP